MEMIAAFRDRVITDSAIATACRLTVVMPVYNEAATLEQSILRLLACCDVDELIVVDDGSSDDTLAILSRLQESPSVSVLRHATNQGKGAALKTGFTQASGDVVIVQDADLEYDPIDLGALVEPILHDEADVVFGTRFCHGRPAGIRFISYVANRVITAFFNVVFRQRLTDVETCYKVMRRDVLQQIAPTLVENRFGVEIELTARIVKIANVRIAEVPIRYSPRTRAQGKKIGWRDGVRALWCILRYRMSV
jgi:glycosyltransferase involved in cell wall biosynthesis